MPLGAARVYVYVAKHACMMPSMKKQRSARFGAALAFMLIAQVAVHAAQSSMPHRDERLCVLREGWFIAGVERGQPHRKGLVYLDLANKQISAAGPTGKAVASVNEVVEASYEVDSAGIPRLDVALKSGAVLRAEGISAKCFADFQALLTQARKPR